MNAGASSPEVCLLSNTAAASSSGVGKVWRFLRAAFTSTAAWYCAT